MTDFVQHIKSIMANINEDTTVSDVMSSLSAALAEEKMSDFPVRGKIAEDDTFHESFGCIAFNRVQGSCNLFGSSIRHHGNFIEMTLSRAVLIDCGLDGQGDRVFPKNEIVRVRMSNAQFADAITNMNVMPGIPCTITRVNGNSMQDTPYLQTPTEKVQSRIVEGVGPRIEQIVANLAEIEKEVDASTLTKAAKTRIKSLLIQSKNKMDAGFHRFMVDQLSEATEKMVSNAKTEIEAMMTGIIQRTGIAALKGESMKMLRGQDDA